MKRKVLIAINLILVFLMLVSVTSLALTDVKVTKISLNESMITMGVGQTVELKATISPADATNRKLIWVSSNKKIVTVSNGKVKAVKMGNAIVTVKSSGTENVTVKCKITVSKAKSTVKKGQSWTWNTSPVSFSYFMAESWYTQKWDPKNIEYDKKVTKETGVSFSKMDGGDGTKLSAVIAAGNLPDIMSMWVGYTQRTMLEDNDKLFALNDLIKLYAPTFTNIPKSMTDWFKNSNTGKTYCIADYFFTPELIGDAAYNTSHNRITARKDIMDKLGIKAEDFSTKDGMVAALKKVKDANVQYKGFTVKPFYLGASIQRQSVEFLAQYFGVDYEDKTGNWLDYRKQPETLEALLFANRLYREGLLDGECLTIDNRQLDEKVNGGIIFCTNGVAGSTPKALQKEDPNAYMVPVGPLKGDNGRAPYLRGISSSGWVTTVITKNCKNPDRAVRFLEYLMTTEKMIESAAGPKGIVWNYGSDGRIQYTDEYTKAKADDPVTAQKKYGVNTLFMTYNELMIQPFMPLPTDPIDKHFMDIDKYYARYTFNSTPFDELVPDGGTDEAAIDTKLNKVWDQAIARIIVAKSETDARTFHKQTLDDMDKEGWQKWYDVQNVKFQDCKERLGLKLAHPYNQ